MSSINLLSSIYTDFVSILEKSVVKFTAEADKYETLDIRKKADAYLRAATNTDVFETYLRYEKDIIAEVMGLVDEDEINDYYLNAYKIPNQYRKTLLIRQRRFIIDNYVEENNYYRNLLGLPNIEDTEEDFIYLDPEIAEEYGLPSDVPIHEFTYMQLSYLQTYGVLDKIIKNNPTKVYLKYIGPNKIDLVTSRTAKNFGLLKVPTTIAESVYDSFTRIYEQCREYFYSCIYVSEYKQTIDYYDNFIGMCIMLMTLQQLLSRALKNIIDRDFFDDYTVKILFDNYGIPYHSYMDRGTRKYITQNLNLLVLNKGNNQVIYDIASLLGYNRLNIYKYYLVKARKFDAYGDPITEYTTDPDTGEEVYDYEKMFNIYFQKVDIKELDAFQSMLDSSNKVSYLEVTNNDPFWIEDRDLLKELYQAEYNFVESKYLGISISYKMTRILFENIYLLRMLLDKKNEIPFINVELPKISLNLEVSLFDAIVALCMITSKINHLKGNILVDPTKILHVLGFNFELDFDKLREDIESNPYLDNALTRFFEDTSIYSKERITELYENFTNLYYALVDGMSKTRDIDAYHAYKDLYDTIFYANENQKIFNIGTVDEPVYAETFDEYLKFANHDIYNFINSIEEDQLYIYANHIASKIMEIIPNLKNLGIYSDTSSNMETMLVDLINFFKSYTVDLINLKIIYIFDLKSELMIKFLDWLKIHAHLYPKENFLLSYADHLLFHAEEVANAKMPLEDKIVFKYSLLVLNDIIDLHSLIGAIHEDVSLKEFFMILDIALIRKEISRYEGIDIHDFGKLYGEVHKTTEMILKDKGVQNVLMKTSLNDKMMLKDEPGINNRASFMIKGTPLDKLKFYEKLIIYYK